MLLLLVQLSVTCAPETAVGVRPLGAAGGSSPLIAVRLVSADIVLSLHRSEGFGLVPAEAMLLGRPVVATGWSGNMTFMDDSCAALVGYRLVPARDPRGVYAVPGATWAEPDIAHAAEWLRRLGDDPGLRARLGPAGQVAARARLGTAPLAEAVRALGLAVPA